MLPISVLLVDDHQVVREGLKRMLDLQEDIVVVGEAASGLEAISQAEKLVPDVVLMDIKMPEMDGITATRQIKEKLPRLNIIMLTLYDGEHLTQAIEAGASGYMLKDASKDDLVQAIHNVSKGYAPVAISLTRHILTQLTSLNQGNQSSLLSERQCAILRLVAAGVTSRDIGDNLYVSEATVKKEMTNIFNKLGVSDRAQAVSEAMKRNLI